jgi:hypothetical protein
MHVLLWWYSKAWIAQWVQGKPRNQNHFRPRSRGFSLLHSINAISGAHSASHLTGSANFFPRVSDGDVKQFAHLLLVPRLRIYVIISRALSWHSFKKLKRRGPS